MEVHFAPELQAKIDQLVIETGRAPDKLLEDAMAGYVAELAETRELLDRRYDDLKSGKVKPVDGEAFFETLRKREDELLTSNDRRAGLRSSPPRGPSHRRHLDIYRG